MTLDKIRERNKLVIRQTIANTGLTHTAFAKANGITYRDIDLALRNGYSSEKKDMMFSIIFPGYTLKTQHVNALKEYRLSKGMTQKELAKVLGITLQHVSNLERNLNLASTRLRVKITETIGINLNGYQNMRYISVQDLVLIHYSQYTTNELAALLFKSKAFIEQVKSKHFYGPLADSKEVKNYKKPEITLPVSEFALLRNFSQVYPDKLKGITKIKDGKTEYLELSFKGDEFITLLPVPLGSSFLDLEHDRTYLPQEMWL